MGAHHIDKAGKASSCRPEGGERWGESRSSQRAGRGVVRCRRSKGVIPRYIAGNIFNSQSHNLKGTLHISQLRQTFSEPRLILPYDGEQSLTLQHASVENELLQAGYF